MTGDAVVSASAQNVDGLGSIPTDHQFFRLDLWAGRSHHLPTSIVLTLHAIILNHHVKFTFARVRTDVCNFCYEYVTCRNGLQIPDKLIKHEKDVENYTTSKEGMMSEENALCCESDFSQNLLLPKIPINEQFCKRLLWLFIFNIHILGEKKESKSVSGKKV